MLIRDKLNIHSLCFFHFWDLHIAAFPQQLLDLNFLLLTVSTACASNIGIQNPHKEGYNNDH